jgi:hypothetical protein
MAEWSIAVVLKTTKRELRGFESLSLRRKGCVALSISGSPCVRSRRSYADRDKQTYEDRSKTEMPGVCISAFTVISTAVEAGSSCFVLPGIIVKLWQRFVVDSRAGM